MVQIDLARVRKLRSDLVSPDAVQGLADTFSALGDPTRVRILDVLSHGELCVCDLAAVLGLSQSAVSHQLRLLRNIRLVKPRRDGRIVFYSLDDAAHLRRNEIILPQALKRLAGDFLCGLEKIV